MGIKSRDWKQIGDYITRMKSEKLTYKEGAKRFGLKVTDIYEYQSYGVRCFIRQRCNEPVKNQKVNVDNCTFKALYHISE